MGCARDACVSDLEYRGCRQQLSFDISRHMAHLVSKGVPCTRTGLLSLKLVAGLLMPDTCGESVSLADTTKPGVRDLDLLFS